MNIQRSLILIVLIKCLLVAGTNFYVSTNGTNTYPCGTSLQTACGSFGLVLNQTSSEDTIIFAAGTYEFVGPFNSTLSLMHNLSIVSESGSSSTIVNLNGYQFLYVEESTLHVKGFTFSNGSGVDGAVFSMMSSELLLDDMVFTYNMANHSGGAIYSEIAYNYTGPTKVSVSNSVFRYNNAQDEGGSISLIGVPLDLENVVFEYNTSPGQGGGVYCLAGYVSGTNVTAEYNSAGNSGGFFHANNFCDNSWNSVTMRYNEAGNQGGGVYLSSSTMFVDSSQFTNNTSYGVGGAISVDSYGSGFHANDCVFLYNTGLIGGGGIDSQAEGRLFINRSKINYNAGGNGAGFSLRNYAQAHLYSTEVLDNVGNNGGAIYLLSSCEAYLYDSTLQENSAKNGGGMYCADSDVFFHNSSLKQNSPGSESDIFCSYFPSLTYCKITGDSQWTSYCKEPQPDNTSAILKDKRLLAVVIGVPLAVLLSAALCGVSCYQYHKAKKNGTLPGWLRLPTNSKDHNYDFDDE